MAQGKDSIKVLYNKIQTQPLWFMDKVLGRSLWLKQEEIVRSLQVNKKTTVKACHGVGKCKRYDENIILSTGEVKTAEELLGTAQEIKSFNSDGDQIDTLATFTDNGIQECVKIITQSGRVIECTTNHPLWLGENDCKRPYRWNGMRSRVNNVGWKNAEEFRPGHLIKITSKLNVKNEDISLSDDQIKFLGYMCGDGGCTTSTVFTNTNEVIIQEMRDILKTSGISLIPEGEYGYRISKGSKGHTCNPWRDLLREQNLFGHKSKDKRVPESIFKSSDRQVTLFISRLFACDGWITNVEASICLASKGMIEDLRILFLRLGLVFSYRERKVKSNLGKTHDAYELSLRDKKGLLKFYELFGGKFGEPHKSEYMQHGISLRSKDKVPTFKEHFCNKWERWDIVKSVEFTGKHPTVCVSVPETNVFLTEFVEHNSFLSGNLVLWFLYGFRPSIVLTTAPTWRQVEKLVWKEVRSSYARSTIPLGGDFSPKSPELQMIQDQWYAAGLSTTDANKFQGFHEKNVLVIVDEAAGVGEAIFEGIEGVLTSENAKLLLIGNPTNTSGAFFESFKDPGFKKITISAFDSPNFKWAKITEDDIRTGAWVEKEKYARALNGGKILQPNMITPEWVADKYKRWKPGSPLYESKVAGNFPAQGKDTLIPIAWVEAAIERWYDMTEKSSTIELGVDVAEYGSDVSVIAPRIGDKCLELLDFSGIGIMDLSGEVINVHRRLKSTAIKVDVIGIGTGVQGRLAEQGFPAIRVNVAESPGGSTEEEVDEMKSIFINKRSQLWWNLRERLNPDVRVNPDPIALPPDEELTFELTNIRYKIKSNGKIQIESKEELRKRIGRSSDRGDAVMLAFAPTDLLGTGEWEVNVR